MTPEPTRAGVSSASMIETFSNMKTLFQKKDEDYSIDHDAMENRQRYMTDQKLETPSDSDDQKAERYVISSKDLEKRQQHLGQQQTFDVRKDARKKADEAREKDSAPFVGSYGHEMSQRIVTKSHSNEMADLLQGASLERDRNPSLERHDHEDSSVQTFSDIVSR